MLVNDDIVHWKTWWNMFAYFSCRWIFRTILISINLFYYTVTICINNKRCFIRFFDIDLVSSTGIITLQKSSFPLIFLCDSSFFLSKGMKAIQTVKITIIFWRNSSLYCWSFFYCKIIPLPSTLALRFSPFKIIRRITCFSRSELCFET